MVIVLRLYIVYVLTCLAIKSIRRKKKEKKAKRSWIWFWLVLCQILDQIGPMSHMGPGPISDIGPGPMWHMGLAYYWQVRILDWVRQGPACRTDREAGIKSSYSRIGNWDWDQIFWLGIAFKDWDWGSEVGIVIGDQDANLPIVCQSHVPHWTRSNVRDWTRSHVGHRTNLVQS